MSVSLSGGGGPALGQYEGFFIRPGNALYYGSVGNTSTAAPSNNQARAVPLYVPVACTFDRIGVDVTIVGQAGSVVRLGIYADTGSGYPGTLVGDYGTVAGDATAQAEIIIAQAMTPGLYWLTEVVQSAVTTQPTMRAISGIMPPMPLGATAAVTSSGAWAAAGVSGALPGTFPAGAILAAAIRVFVRVT